MTQKKRAELQRKLSMAPVARPPGDLLDRLKNDIPHDLLSTQRDRERLSRSVAFNLRVAAAVILMITGTFALVQFLLRGESRSAAARPPLSERRLAPPHSEIVARQKAAEVAEVTVTLAEPVGREAKKNDAPIMLADKDQPREEDEKLQAKTRNEVAAVSGVIGGTVAELAAAAAPSQAQAPPVAEPAPVDTFAAAPVALRKEARSADRIRTGQKALFGISVDEGEFGRLKNLIERGQTPVAQEINIEALVNHFAGSAPPRRDIRLDAEGSRPPLAGDTAVLRYSIDTSSDAPSLMPVATNARLDIELNAKAIAGYRIVADGARISATEAILVKNVSATGLIELTLRPGVKPRERVATVRLRYRSVADGREHLLVDSVDVGEITRNWIAATRRHRLATLGAVWGESLKGKAATAGDVARKAEELATEEPGDERARDLANAATASSRRKTF